MAVAVLLLGLGTARRLYADRPAPQPFSLLASSFLPRLQVALKFALDRIGLEAVCDHLKLPRPIAMALMGAETCKGNADLAECRSLESSPASVLVPKFHSSEEKLEAVKVVQLTEEEKSTAVSLYNRGVKLHYIAGLYDILNPKAISSWGDWKKRPKFEADNNIEKRTMLMDRLQRGEDPKAIRADLHLKERVYRELLGVPIKCTFSYDQYELAVREMNSDKSTKMVCKNLGIPSYFIRRWLQGKGMPPKPLFEEDHDGAIDTKKKAILKFYEGGNAAVAAKAVGLSQPSVVERWVMKYQQAVDERDKSDAVEASKDNGDKQ